MKAYPHTHIGIARDDYGMFIGTRFLGSPGNSVLIDQLLEYYPLTKSAIIIPVSAATRWELEETTKKVTTTEWVEKGEDN